MKTLFIISFAVAIFSIVTAKRLKCYEIISTCPKVMSPCPKPSYCGGGTLSEREDGCCCLPKCDDDEIFFERAMILADPTCDQQSPFPSAFEGPAGCFCKSGFVRDRNNKCIPTDECPKPITACNRNETYDDCGQIEQCEASCKSMDMPNPNLVCPAVCKKGCFCKEGYVRDRYRSCILMTDCPDPECFGAHEVYLKCNSICNEPTCHNPRQFACGFQCKKGCFCEKGYVRNAERKCIPIDHCPNHEL